MWAKTDKDTLPTATWTAKNIPGSTGVAMFIVDATQRWHRHHNKRVCTLRGFRRGAWPTIRLTHHVAVHSTATQEEAMRPTEHVFGPNVNIFKMARRKK